MSLLLSNALKLVITFECLQGWWYNITMWTDLLILIDLTLLSRKFVSNYLNTTTMQYTFCVENVLEAIIFLYTKNSFLNYLSLWHFDPLVMVRNGYEGKGGGHYTYVDSFLFKLDRLFPVFMERIGWQYFSFGLVNGISKVTIEDPNSMLWSWGTFYTHLVEQGLFSSHP